MNLNRPHVQYHELGYDLAGDTTSDGVNNYWYDAEGRLCAVQTYGGVTQYFYDAEGARIAKGALSAVPAAGSSCSATSLASTSGVTLNARYLVDLGGNQVTELNGSGGWQHSNIWLAGHLSATYDTKGLHFPLTDALGTKRVQMSALGTWEEHCTSLPFGNDVNNPNSVQCTLNTAATTADDATEHHFTGKERDSESGNDYFPARYYNSAMGRWLSPDWSAKEDPVPYAQLADPQSLNLYAYVRNNPLTRVDLDGHCWGGGWCDIHGNPYQTDSEKKAAMERAKQQNTSVNNTSFMLWSNSGSGGSANPRPSAHTALVVTMDWMIIPNVDNLSQVSQAIVAAGDKNSNSLILLLESKKGGTWKWQEPKKGAGQDFIDMGSALPVEQKWYINTGGVNNSSNQRIQLVIGMNPDGTLRKAWTALVTEGLKGPHYEAEDQK